MVDKIYTKNAADKADNRENCDTHIRLILIVELSTRFFLLLLLVYYASRGVLYIALSLPLSLM